MTTPIPVKFSTNAPAVAKEVDELAASVKREAAAEAARLKAIKSIVSAEREAKASAHDLTREIQALTKAQGNAGRVFSSGGAARGGRSNSPGGGGGGGPGGVLGSAGRMFRGLNGVPGAESVGRYLQIAGGSAGGAVSGLIGMVAPAIATMAIMWKRAAVKAEEMSALASASFQAARTTFETLRNARLGNAAAAAGGFDSVSGAAKLLIARGGESAFKEAQGMTAEGLPDAMQGMAAALRIKDEKKRQITIEGARLTAATGEGSFSGSIERVANGEMGVSGNAEDMARAMIGISRGTGPISQESFLEMRKNLRFSKTAQNISLIEGTRGVRDVAGQNRSLALQQTTEGFARETDQIKNPEEVARREMVRGLEATIEAMRIAATAQDGLSAAFADLMAKTGLSKGSLGVQTERQVGAMRAGAGL